MSNKPGENKAAAGLMAAKANAEQALANAAPVSVIERVREIVARSLMGSDFDIFTQGQKPLGVKAISKAASMPLEDVQLILKAFDDFLQSTASQLTHTAAGLEIKP